MNQNSSKADLGQSSPSLKGSLKSKDTKDTYSINLKPDKGTGSDIFKSPNNDKKRYNRQTPESYQRMDGQPLQPVNFLHVPQSYQPMVF